MYKFERSILPSDLLLEEVTFGTQRIDDGLKERNEKKYEERIQGLHLIWLNMQLTLKSMLYKLSKYACMVGKGEAKKRITTTQEIQSRSK